MSKLSRRTFVTWIGAISTLLGLRKRAEAGELPPTLDPSGDRQATPLDGALLLALAQAVLPAELGASGLATTARKFSSWLGGYRGGAELLHGYGTGQLSFAAASPVGRWREQLRSLDDAARARNGKGFATLGIEQRQQMVRAALAGEKLASFPAPQAASHVAVALMAWYFGSSDATDLCYGVELGKNRCRPLALNPNEPAPLRRGGPVPRGLMPGNEQ